MPEPSDEPYRYNTTTDGTTTVAETIRVSGRDFERILELLKNNPRPNAKLQAAIASLPDTV